MWICNSFMTLLFPPASEAWEWECQVPVKASLVRFKFGLCFVFSQALIQSVGRGRGVTQPQSPLQTIGQGTKTSLTRGVKW